MSDRAQRTEQPTPKRLDKAHKEGQFPASRDFVAGCQFLAVVALLSVCTESWVKQIVVVSRDVLTRSFRTEVTPLEVNGLLWLWSSQALVPLFLGGAAVAAASTAVHLATTRLGFSTERLAPDFKRLNPLRRIRELPRQNVPQLLQSLILLPLICYAVYHVVQDRWGIFLRLPLEAVATSIRVVADSIIDLLWKAAGILVVWGAIDLYRQKRRHQSDLKMTKQEVRDEVKEAEGNPHVRSRLRRLRRELLRRRMMAEVAKATAVVVNPTHFAVALRYEVDSMAAPAVVAKGKNFLAQRIRERAREHGIPIIENPLLAQALYKSVDVGQEIPAHLYRAVAEVLAYIFSLGRWRK
ncbi:MAG: flagellar biosynthesis protein FlhB [Bryobacteraceae bacterium]